MNAPVNLRTGLEELDRDECLRLLRSATLGRLAVVIGGQPLVFPVNFTLDGDAVVSADRRGHQAVRARATARSRSSATTSTCCTTPAGASS